VSEDVHVRSVIHYTDYKRYRTSITIHYNGQDITNNKDNSTTTPTGSTAPADASKPPPPR
jgi:hypothetical protein